jgi:hypothetical protein
VCPASPPTHLLKRLTMVCSVCSLGPPRSQDGIWQSRGFLGVIPVVEKKAEGVIISLGCGLRLAGRASGKLGGSRPTGETGPADRCISESSSGTAGQLYLLFSKMCISHCGTSTYSTLLPVLPSSPVPRTPKSPHPSSTLDPSSIISFKHTI